MKSYLKQSACALGIILCSTSMASEQVHAPVLTLLWPEAGPAHQSFSTIKETGLAEAVITMAEQRMALRGPVTVVLGGGGKPRISQDSQVVVMPYEHLQQIEKDLSNGGAKDHEQRQVALDAFTYSLVHQLAHVAIEQQEESGQWLGEDAAADLTMITLLEHIPDGARIARNALSLFDKQAIGMVRETQNFWSSHELNAERYWAGICQLLGSGQVLDEVLPEDQMSNEECRVHYAALRNSWGQMFAQGLLPLEPESEVASR